MRAIIGYGNTLRGEDGFGVEFVRLLHNYDLKNTTLIELYQLTPELCLELMDMDELIFVDAAYSKKNHYALACHLTKKEEVNLSHHISPKMIISLLNKVYNKYPSYQIYSMFTDEFDIIFDKNKYQDCLRNLVNYLVKG